jgi:GNAT superfamily N-acetyltransferase
VGTVTTRAYGRTLGWIGMMVVTPAARHQGVGRALMDMALRHLREAGIPTVKLDATPAGRPLYESLGFSAEACMERWQGIARPKERLEGPGLDACSLRMPLRYRHVRR